MTHEDAVTASSSINDLAIACDLTTLTDDQREHLFAISKRLFAEIVDIQHIPGGYQLKMPDAQLDRVSEAGVFVALDSLCCPFIRHGLVVEAGSDAWLQLSGGEGVKGFLETELKTLLSVENQALL